MDSIHENSSRDRSFSSPTRAPRMPRTKKRMTIWTWMTIMMGYPTSEMATNRLSFRASVSKHEISGTVSIDDVLSSHTSSTLTSAFVNDRSCAEWRRGTSASLSCITSKPSQRYRTAAPRWGLHSVRTLGSKLRSQQVDEQSQARTTSHLQRGSPRRRRRKARCSESILAEPAQRR